MARARYFLIFLLIINNPATAAVDETPKNCVRVGIFAAMVAAEYKRFIPEEEAGRINVVKAGEAKLREIVHEVYKIGLNPAASQDYFEIVCDNTAP